MTDEIRALLARYLPGYEVDSITRLEKGLANAAYDVDGGQAPGIQHKSCVT